MKKFTSLLLMVILTASALYGAGTTAADFLNISLGARPVAMGDSFTGVPGDIYSIYYNPAGLFAVDRMQGSFMHASWLGQASYGNLLFAYPEDNFTAGLMVNYMGVKKVTGLDEYGFKTGEDHTPSDMAVTGSFALSPLNRLSAGINLKYIRSVLTEDDSGNAFALDIGGQYAFIDGDLVGGLSLKNLGTQMEIGSSHPLPLKVSAGGIYRVRDDLLAAMDISLTKAKFVVSAGGEYSRDLGPVDSSLRLGYSLKDSEMGGIAGLRCGVGIRWNDYVFDYAWRPGGDLGTTHLFSLTVEFGKSYSRREKEKEIVDLPQAGGIVRTVNSFVAGNIKDEEGKPLADVTVRIDRYGEEVARIFTDSKGNYQSEPMVPGIYEVKVWERGYLYQTVEIEISESAPVKMDFTLRSELDK